jgi:hypothetical protein
MSFRQWYVLAVSLASGPLATVEYTYCDTSSSCVAPVTYTDPSLTTVLSTASAVAAATMNPSSAAHALVVYTLPAVARVGEVGLVPTWPTITAAMVRSMFGTLPPGATLNTSVHTRDQVEAVGIMSLQTSAVPSAAWRSGSPVTLATAQSGFVAINMRRATPAAASFIVNGAKRVYTDAAFFRSGFADVPALPGYMTPPPAGVASINDLVTEVGFRDVVLAAGGPDLFAGPGFDPNVATALDPFMPDPLVLAPAQMVGTVVAQRVTELVTATGAQAVILCGDMAQVGLHRFNMAVRDRMAAIGMPVPFAFASSCATQELTRVMEGASTIESAVHRP